MIAKILDQKTKQIADEIATAKMMKEKAEKLLIEAEKFHKDSIEFSNNLLLSAELESQKLITEAQKSLEDEINKKIAAAEERIKTEEEKLIRDIKSKIIMAAIQVVEENILKSDKKKRSESSIEKAIEDFSKTVH